MWVVIVKLILYTLVQLTLVVCGFSLLNMQSNLQGQPDHTWEATVLGIACLTVFANTFIIRHKTAPLWERLDKWLVQLAENRP